MPDQLDQSQADVGTPTKTARRRVPQSKVPRFPLTSALRVPRTLADHFAKAPTRPLDIAAALNMSPSSGTFRNLCGAALGYGLTSGGPNSQSIGLTDLGRQIVSPLREGDDAAAMRDAVLTPSVEREFLERYDGSPLPANHIAHNVLETMGVPVGATERVYEVIRENAKTVTFIKTIRDRDYIDLSSVQRGLPPDLPEVDGDSAAADSADQQGQRGETTAMLSPSPQPTKPAGTERVFVSSSANPEIASQIATLLKFGGREAVTKTDADALADDGLLGLVAAMHECSSGVFFLGTQAPRDASQIDRREGVSARTLLELGAAVALFGSQCVLLVETGAKVPSAIEGLPRVEYSPDGLTLTELTDIVSALMSGSEVDE